MHWSSYLPNDSTPVAAWTLDECSAYVMACEESESEHYAEWGSGAVSLGYSASDLGGHYDGYRASGDPKYREARARLDAERPAPAPAPVVAVSNDDIPF